MAAGAALAYCWALTSAGLGALATRAAGAPGVDPFAGFGPVRLGANLAYLLLLALYLAWLASPRPASGGFPELLRPAAPFLLIAFVTYPLSSDVLQYLQYGAMLLRGVNPYLTRAADFPSDVAPMIAWPGATAVYGPAALLLFAAPARLLAAGVPAAVYGFKALCLLLHVANGYLVWRLVGLESRSGGLARNVALAYLLNPLLLTQQVADAHVDVLLNSAVLVLAGCLVRGKDLGAVAALAFAIMVKALALIWAPILGLFLVRKRAWAALLQGVLLVTLVGLVLGHTLLEAQHAWRSLLPRVSATARSLHHVVWLALDHFTNAPAERKQAILSLVRQAATGGFLAFYAWVLWRRFSRAAASGSDALLDMGWTTLALLAFATMWVMPWYPSVLLAVVPFTLRHQRFTLAAFTYCLSIGLVLGGGAGRGACSILAALATFAPPALVLAFGRRAHRLDLVRFLGGSSPPPGDDERPRPGPAAA